jgi:glucosamine--fructose-6-phosphate aminotransferase (isomerizing)
VLACLLNRLLEQSQTLDQACRSLLFLVRGSYAVAAFFEGQPDLMFVARNGSPLALGFKGVGEGCDSEVFVGSDALALAGMCEELSYLEDGDFGYLRPGEAVLYDSLGAEAERDRVAMPGAGLVADKGDWPHFMRKEIEEQPESLERVIYELFDIANLKLRPMLRDVNFAEIDRVVLLACGTAHYACHVASYWIEHFARVPVEIDLASEYRYRNRPLTGRELVVAVSQSGETADTLSAFKTLKGRVAARVGVVNVATSSIAREADAILDILAGPEIGVASTKAFTGQVAALMALALKIAVARKTVCDDILASAIGDIATVPMIVRKTLEGAKEIEAAARDLAQSSDIYFLGRDVNYPIALEAALKLKEISYIHSEAYAAGELKHGPIALIDNGTPVVVFESPGLLGEKTASNVAEVEARGAKVVAVGSSVAADIQVPASGPIAACFAYAAVAQLIAYFVAVEKGTDVDQPRNLAKSVTVE